MTLPPPTLAYDLELLKTPPARDTGTDHGWCYGLPPGITPNQWPLSPFDGYPMQPCFTVKIPAQYRSKGPSHVALCMFADQQHDEPDEAEAIAEYFRTDSRDRHVRAAAPSAREAELRRRYRRNFRERFSELLFGHVQIVSALQIDPEVRPVAKQLAEAQGHRGRDRLLLTEDVEQGLTRNSEQAGNLGFGLAESRQHIFAQHFAGMHGL
jgi:hypothetical protein